MIGRYTDGYLGRDRAGHYFKHGLKLVFRDVTLPDAEDLLDATASETAFIMWVCRSRGSFWLTPHSVPGSIGYNPSQDLIVIAPDTLVDGLRIHFSAVAQDLRDKKGAKLRANFEARFDYDDM